MPLRLDGPLISTESTFTVGRFLEITSLTWRSHFRFLSTRGNDLGSAAVARLVTSQRSKPQRLKPSGILAVVIHRRLSYCLQRHAEVYEQRDPVEAGEADKVDGADSQD